jgi:phage tail-like protein
MALESLDNAAANGFRFSFDGIALQSVSEIAGLNIEIERIDIKQQTPDGKYIPRNLIGRKKNGSFTVTQGVTGNKSIHDWLKLAQGGDVAGARKTACIELLDYTGETVQSFNFENCWVGKIEQNTLKAGAAEQATHKFTVYYDEATIG